MREDEPLEGWLFLVRMWAEHGPAQPQERSGQALNRLSQALVAQPEGKVNYDRISGRLPSSYANTAFSADEAPEAQRLYLQVWERGGAGSTHVAEGLLQGITLALEPASVPFWRQLLDLSRPRDKSTARRRTMALAALALLAIVRDDAAAYAALAEALAHPHEQVRALGAFYLSRAYVIPGRPLPAVIEAALSDLATSDRAFAPRFQARAALRALGCPAPRDTPDSVYFLKVQLRGHRATRTIAILADDTLSDLHYEIQGAFGWDADHLYSFFMGGGRDDQRYEIRCPALGDGGDFKILSMTIVDERGQRTVVTPPPADEPVDDEPPDEDEDGAGAELYTTTAEIGALGLVPKHQFIYFFDYGDSHEFVVTVLGVETRTDDGDYPRVVEARGEAPRQYHWYEDEGEGDEER